MIFFIGIKGAGMAALACLLQEMGEVVEGSDLPTHFFTQASLDAHHIPLHDLDHLPPEPATIIIGNAFPESFDAVVRARANPQYRCYRYHEYLGLMTRRFSTIAVTGSHGKTTTTKMMSAVMAASTPTAYLIGDGHGHMPKDASTFVIEADEYRRFFHHYHPQYAIITNIDYDHVDYYKDAEDYRLAYVDFIERVEKRVWVYGADPEIQKLPASPKLANYGIDGDYDLAAYDLIETPTETQFNLRYFDRDLGRIRLPFSGRHLVWNALGCIGVALDQGLSLSDVERGLSHYTSAARRFIVDDQGANVYIDDYAHHPTEVKVTIDAARLRYPKHKLIAIFKPHRVSRLNHFLDAFAQALDQADEVFLCEFGAIDDQEEGIDIDISHLQKRCHSATVILEDDAAAAQLSQRGPACYLFMSSKDIYGLAEKLKRYQNS